MRATSAAILRAPWRLMARRKALAALVLAAPLSACSLISENEIVPGYQPDGSYILSARESAQNCSGLKAERDRYQRQANSSRARIGRQRDKSPYSLVDFLERLTQSEISESTAEAELKQNEAAIGAYNLEIQARGCEAEQPVPASLSAPTLPAPGQPEAARPGPTATE